MKNQIQILLDTSRLLLRLPNVGDSEKFQEFDDRNLKHLSPWRAAPGEHPRDYKTLLAKWEQEFEEGRSIRFLLFLKEDSKNAIIGFCNFTQIFRSAFQACYLGYHIDAAFEG